MKSNSVHPIIGFIGCGNIGGKQARNLLTHGYPLYVYDINPDRMIELQQVGAQITHSCAEIGQRCNIVFTALPTPADVIEAVLEGEKNLSQGLQPHAIYIDITTNDPKVVKTVAQVLKQQGVRMLDAPFNDSPVGSETLEGVGLALLCSGAEETFQQVEPILQLMADDLIYCGDIGQATQCKLIHNAVNAVAVQAVSEGITLALAQGIDLSTIWEVLRMGAFGQNAGDIHGLPHYWFSRRCDDISQPPAFTVKLLHKDLKLTLAMAAQNKVPVPQMSLMMKDYEEALQRGWSDYAATKVRCLQEERASVIAEKNIP
ncbi:NAD(P)-dependent oxidoreductase [Cyanothece sp. BG0011]|uniref:NAD(P)-dependent oxidoreductase n=1 Tax=Cyanothece sp. BG0011 TaxID=2082950 RepID=UPI000D1F66AA|nr:NAD(P)-dependent oxidoreductase [Cyanothece sp. BG0011]